MNVSNEIDRRMNFSGIYSIVNMNNFKVYIGKSVNVGRRIGNHLNFLSQNKHNNKYLQNSFNKHLGNFLFCLIEEVEDTGVLDEKERYYIEYYQCLHDSKKSFGYNLTIGGDGGVSFSHTQESKDKIRKANTGREHTKETKEHLSRVMKGRPIPEDTRKSQLEKVSIPIVQVTTTGEIYYWESASEACRELGLSSLSSIRRCCNDESILYNDSYWFKRSYYESTDFVFPTKKPSGRPIVQLSLEGEFISYWENSMQPVEKSNGFFTNSCISRCCRNESKKHKGYKWMYYDDYIKLHPLNNK